MSQVSVDWGDGHVEEKDVTPDGDGDWSLTGAKHTYAGPGRYRVSVAGLAGGVGGQTVVITAPDPVVTITVPANIAVEQNVAKTYSTSLKNTGGGVSSATQTIRLSVDTGTLAPADVVYETEDTGTWTTKTFTVVDAKTIETTEKFPIPAGLDASSDVRITVKKVSGTVVKGRSTVKEGSDTLATADYTYTVGTPAPAAAVITSVSPASVPSLTQTTITVTGTGFTGAVALQGGMNGNNWIALDLDFHVVSDTQITALINQGGTGQLNLRVEKPGAPLSNADKFVTIT